MFDNFDLFETCEEYYNENNIEYYFSSEEPAEGITDEEIEEIEE